MIKFALTLRIMTCECELSAQVQHRKREAELVRNHEIREEELVRGHEQREEELVRSLPLLLYS